MERGRRWKNQNENGILRKLGDGGATEGKCEELKTNDCKKKTVSNHLTVKAFNPLLALDLELPGLHCDPQHQARICERV